MITILLWRIIIQICFIIIIYFTSVMPSFKWYCGSLHIIATICNVKRKIGREGCRLLALNVFYFSSIRLKGVPGLKDPFVLVWHSLHSVKLTSLQQERVFRIKGHRVGSCPASCFHRLHTSGKTKVFWKPAVVGLDAPRFHNGKAFIVQLSVVPFCPHKVSIIVI